MSDFYMMVGIPGSGKSTFVKNNFKHIDVVIHSDDVREEIGDTDNSRTHEVWKIINDRITNAIKEDMSIVLDATNVSKKDRLRTLALFNGYSYTKHCIVNLCDFETCIERIENRKRKVPTEAVICMMKRFQIPTYTEGWVDIKFINSNYKYHFIDDLYNKLGSIEQYGKWHIETVLKHSDDLISYMKTVYCDPLLMTVAKYHDIGKLYTMTIDEDGNHHFYGHANVSAYTYLCGTVHDKCSMSFILYVAQMIEHHMDLCNNGNQSKLKSQLSRIHFGADNLYDDLVLFHKADEFCAVKFDDVMDMSLTDFLNTFENWEYVLSRYPFNINIKRDGDYILFKYNQISSDFTFRLVRESRGIIYKNICGEYIVVCRPFSKFFNYNESLADDIVWELSTVTEKMDGSLIKIWFDDSDWHISTNGTIDAYKCSTPYSDKSFGEVFESVLSPHILDDLLSSLDTNFTYLFELIAKDNRVVIDYGKDDIYFLAKIKTDSNLEVDNIMPIPYVNIPIKYNLKSLDSAISLVDSFDDKHEGVVVSDIFGNRIKIKSKKYLELAHQINSISTDVIIKAFKDKTIDDILYLCNDVLIEKINIIKNQISVMVSKLNTWYDNIFNVEYHDRKEFALAVNSSNCPIKSWLFSKYDNKDLSAEDFLLSLNIKSIKYYCNII